MTKDTVFLQLPFHFCRNLFIVTPFAHWFGDVPRLSSIVHSLFRMIPPLYRGNNYGSHSLCRYRPRWWLHRHRRCRNDFRRRWRFRRVLVDVSHGQRHRGYWDADDSYSQPVTRCHRRGCWTRHSDSVHHRWNRYTGVGVVIRDCFNVNCDCSDSTFSIPLFSMTFAWLWKRLGLARWRFLFIRYKHDKWEKTVVR